MSWDWDKLKEQQKSRGGGGPGGGGVPPQMEEFLSRFKEYRPRHLVFLVLVVLAALVLFTSFYRVNTSEQGVVQRFGRYVRTTGPGLHVKAPFGVEKVTKVDVLTVRNEEFTEGVRGSRSYSGDSGAEDPTLMLTGDLNVAVVPWIVQYRVQDPYKYLFKVENVRSTLQDLSESTMRLVVGDRSINEVISKRQEIAIEARELLQQELDQAETGLVVRTIEMKTTNVPPPVQPSFNEVNQAVQEKERMIYQAREEYNKAVPAARGEAERTIKQAEGYATERVNKARGDANRFLAVYEEYKKAPDVTRRRLYLETMRDVLPKLGKKYFVDETQKNLLPLLNLGEAGKGAAK
ncbi:MAG: FtsH protease activity modulator HflK [Deltaproteobacteria bacterium]|nr:FtsH protease activity modulator HflK [Deltaproteobacteria bacterium]